MANLSVGLQLETEKAEVVRIPSETRTIRLDSDVLLKIEELAEQENISISFVINKALRRHVEWEIYAEKFGFEGNVHTIIFKHDRGARTSAYYAEIAKVLFNRLNLKVDAEESDQQLTITVRS